MKSARATKTLSPHEIARFLALLGETGNFALACDRLGRAKSALYKRRQRDRLFDSECIAAVAMFRASCRRGWGGSAPSPAAPLTRATYAGRPQLRRAVPGTLRAPDLKHFLRILAITGNLRIAAVSIGVAASSIHARRRRDPEFAAEVSLALETARANLEMNLLEASGAFADWHLAPSSSDEQGWSERAAGDSAEPDPSGHFATRMTVSQAINLLGRLERATERLREDEDERGSTSSR